MLSAFRQVHKLRQPTEWGIQNFCDSIFDDLDENPHLDAHVTEIRHYKEKVSCALLSFLPYLTRSQQENLEHEFLIVFVTHARKECVLRLERSTPPRQRRSFFQKLTQTSSSILPALDMVRIFSSSDRLTSGMDRGPSIPVLRLPFLSQTPFALRELCLILSFFPAFSPQYKLREEQCYWFCDVVVSTVCAACEGALIVKEKGFKRAGKFGKLSVQLSAPTRKLFIDAYSIVRTLGQSSQLGTLPSDTLARESLHTLVSMLAVPSSEARTRAVMALTRLASQSLEHRQMVWEAGIASKLIHIIPSASPQLQVHLLAALRTVIDESFQLELEPADIDALTNFLSQLLSSNDEVICMQAVSMLRIVALANRGNHAFVVLLSSLSLELRPNCQLPVVEAIISRLIRDPQLITDNVLFPLFNVLSPVAPTQTRTGAVAALTCLVKHYLEHCRVTQMTSPAPDTGKFSNEVFEKLASLLTDSDAVICDAASHGLTELAHHCESPPNFQFGFFNVCFKPNCMPRSGKPSHSSSSCLRITTAMSEMLVQM
jgi:hypothetical protein